MMDDARLRELFPDPDVAAYMRAGLLRFEERRQAWRRQYRIDEMTKAEFTIFFDKIRADAAAYRVKRLAEEEGSYYTGGD